MDAAAVIESGGGPSPSWAWPGGARAAVSLTYDDGLTTHLDVVGPDLAAHGLRGTFFISDQANLVRPSEATRQRWMAMHGGGHEYASHTINHPCTRAMAWVPPPFALETYTLERMAGELDQSMTLVSTLAGGAVPSSFAFPCGSDWIGDPPQSYAAPGEGPFSRRPRREGRPGGSRHRRPSRRPHLGPNGAPAAELIAWVDRAIAEGAWLVFTFHGVGGDYISVTREAHLALLAHLDARRSEVWTERFDVVADYIRPRGRE